MKTQTPKDLQGEIKLGQQIAVIDNGFVYVGDCTYTGGFLRIDSAKNIRVWGTSKGLGELSRGPTSNTVADETGTVLVPVNRVVLFIQAAGWKL